jgi:parvulin-like peptidyl-prolyl isomerase
MRPVLLNMLVVVSVFGTGSGRAEPTLINGLAVVVNDTPITIQEIEDATDEEERLLYYQYSRQPQVYQQKVKQLQSSALELLVERQLILHEFNTAGYKLPESIIEEHIKSTIREEFDNRIRLIKTLHSKDMTFEDYKKQIRERFIVNGMIHKNVGSEVLISPYKIETYYAQNLDKFKVEDQIRLRTIFLRTKSDRDEAATKKEAEEILAEIQGGASFAELAGKKSDGSQRRDKGDWGWINRKQLREDLAEVAFALKPGQPSGVIERTEGWYLMLVEEAKPAHTRPLSEVRDEIEATLKVQEQQRARKRWIDRLKAKSFIRYFTAY